MQNSPSPEQLGYAVGVILGVLFFLGMIAFSIVAIIKAATNKTTGWIIAACIGGAFLLLFIGLFAVGFMKGFSRALQTAREESGSAPTGPAQVITGETVAYSIKIPAGWHIKRHEKAYDIVANYQSMYVGVIAEEPNLGNPENLAKLTRRNIGKVGQNVQMTDPAPVVVDGHQWLTFTASCDIDGIPFLYDDYVYSGQEGSYQIIMWTFQNLAAKKTNQMDQVAQTFTFPK